jgi:hypothetical protein
MYRFLHVGLPLTQANSYLLAACSFLAASAKYGISTSLWQAQDLVSTKAQDYACWVSLSRLYRFFFLANYSLYFNELQNVLK